MSELTAMWLFRGLAAIGCAATAAVIAWKGHGGDWIIIALVSLIASCSIMTA